MTLPITYGEFESDALALGYDEVLERQWKPAAVVEEHVHPFAVKALVVQGDMWLTVDGTTRHLRPGDSFEVGHSVPHAERYGDQGATYWVARRHAARAPHPANSPRTAKA
ncbi:MAG TPA: cupin domain-containing protein [Burkholderiaceae bacterium]|nr:cupin domain-containing protein [Burkholderiaceae bacterium]